MPASAPATGLTSQAGLKGVVKFLQRMGFEKTANQTVPHKRGDNADYQLTDGIFSNVSRYDWRSRLNSKAL